MTDLNFMDNNVVEIIQREGPVLPVKIAQQLGTSILIASAKLSELVSKKLVKISNAKIGGSPIYYVNGQEDKLELLHKYLPDREKQAYNLLKEAKILKDSECEPAIRVALRAIKDFAIAFKYNDEIFWRWYLSPEQELILILDKWAKPEEIKEKIEEKKEIIKDKKEGIRIKKKTKEDEFLSDINNFVLNQGYSVIEELDGKKNKEVYKIVKIKSDLGELNYLLYAKNKKKISDSDLSLAYSKGQGKKIPVLFLTNGELSKKAEKYLTENSFIVFRKI